MSVVQAVGLGGKTVAAVVNYAIHPEVFGNEIGVLSPDLIGPPRDSVEAGAGGGALFVNSAQGRMVTADKRNLDDPKDRLKGYWHDARTWAECLRIGRLMADEALRIVKDARVQVEPTMFCDSTLIRFPVESDLMWGVILGSPLKYPHEADRSIRARIHLVNLGDAWVLSIPREAPPNIGFHLKRKVRGKNNMIFGLTNEAF